jgi:hypothetical protein
VEITHVNFRATAQVVAPFMISFCPLLQGQAVPLAEALAAARYPLTVSNNEFSGAGATVLTTAMDKASVVAIGEDHLTQEIPRLRQLSAMRWHRTVLAQWL